MTLTGSMAFIDNIPGLSSNQHQAIENFVKHSDALTAQLQDAIMNVPKDSNSAERKTYWENVVYPLVTNIWDQIAILKKQGVWVRFSAEDWLEKIFVKQASPFRRMGAYYCMSDAQLENYLSSLELKEE